MSEAKNDESDLNDLLSYFLPKYLIMKGIQIDNRTIMFIGAHPKYAVDDYGNKILTFSNTDTTAYYASNIHARIYTLKGLRKWRKLIGRRNQRCLSKVFFSWVRT